MAQKVTVTKETVTKEEAFVAARFALSRLLDKDVSSIENRMVNPVLKRRYWVAPSRLVPYGLRYRLLGMLASLQVARQTTPAAALPGTRVVSGNEGQGHRLPCLA